MILMKLETILLRKSVLQPAISFHYTSCSVLAPNRHQHRQFSQSFWDSVSSSTPVTFCQESITQLHDLSGLTWWSTIIASTILLRGAITFPLAIQQSKTLARLEKLYDERPALIKELKMETAMAIKKFKWSEKEARYRYNYSFKKQWDKLIVRDNCHPAKATLLVLIQVPMWIAVSWGIRNLIYMRPDPTSADAQLIFYQMVVGGFGWMPNLTEVDHSLILPITLGVLNLSIIEFQQMTKKVEVDTKLKKYATNFFRVLSVCMVPLAASVPSGVCLYWVTSSAFGFLQNLVLLSPKVKRFLNIPKTNSEVEQPYKRLLENIKKKLRL